MTSDVRFSNRGAGSQSLTFLDSRQVSMIDEALSAVGDYGEVHLIIEKGRLRFVVTKRSYDALKWQPGTQVSEIK